MMAPRGAECAYSLGEPGRTFRQVAAQQLRSMCRALGWEDESLRLLQLQSVLFDRWGDYGVPDQPLFPSLIGDDHSPYEYSLAFETGGATELRLLIEAQAKEPAPLNNLAAARQLNAELERLYGADLTRFRLIEDLFLPSEAEAPFLLWHGASVSRGSSPDFKVYLNPAVRGRDRARMLVAEALQRLGFSSSAINALAQLAYRGDADECTYFSLDLSKSPTARVKVYFAHRHVRASELERAFSSAASHRAGDVTHFCQSVLGGEGPFLQKPLTSCLSFVGGSDAPSAVTLHAPVAHYLEDDAVVAARVSHYLAEQGLPVAKYTAALTAFAHRPLLNGPGLQSYASIRRQPSGMRATVYLSPELFDTGSSRSGVRAHLG